MVTKSPYRIRRAYLALYNNYLDACQARGLSLNTISIYQQSIQYFISHMFRNRISPRRIAPTHLKYYIRELYNSGIKMDTIVHYVGCARLFLRSCPSRHVDPEVFDRKFVERVFRIEKREKRKPARTRMSTLDIEPWLIPNRPILKRTIVNLHQRYKVR